MLGHQNDDARVVEHTQATLLPQLLAANPSIDWRTIALDGSTLDPPLELCGSPPSSALALLQAYQRVVRILPKSQDARALALIERGLHSAIQIASMPEHEFMRVWSEMFAGEEALGTSVYRAALSRRSELLHHYVRDIQRNEPHYRAARFK